MLAMFSAATACWTRKLTSVSVADQSLIVWHGKKANEIMTPPPPATALHASKEHHKTAVLIQSDPPWNGKGNVQCETEANGNETGRECEWRAPRVGRRRTRAARRMMVTFPLLRQNNQHQLGAHIERQPRPQREESRGVLRSRSDGGREPFWSRLRSSMLIRHKGVGLMSHNGTDSVSLFAGSIGVSHATEAEGTRHTARLKPTASYSRCENTTLLCI